MRIECLSRSVESLPPALAEQRNIAQDGVFSVEVGKQYVVYGITLHHGYFWYYICDEDDLHYPVWNPSPLFRIVDPRLSSYWLIGEYSSGYNMDYIPIIAFDEWVNNPIFYDRLTDGDQDAVAVFEKYKQLIDEEAGR